MRKIILASGSPRRKMLMEMVNLAFQVKVISTDESFPSHIPHHDAAMHIAKNKALAVKQQLNDDSIILSADTLVIVDDMVLTKPVDRDEAIIILKQLSGKTHRVITGVCIIDGNVEHQFYECTEVTFKHLTHQQIVYYIDTDKPFDKAGAYAIQEWIGLIGVTTINGDYYNVIGLPINRVFDILIKITA